MAKTIKNSKKTTNLSKKDKLGMYLKNGNVVTEKVAKSRFGLKNLRATISDLREEGMKIETTRTTEGYLKYVLA